MSGAHRIHCSSILPFLLAMLLHLMTENITLSLYTWFDALEFCQEQGDRMTLNPFESDQFFWTGNHQRLSNWIKILGCYNGSEVVKKSKLSFSMQHASVGLCQDFCLHNNYSLLAVKSENCVCLDDRWISYYEKISLKSCDYTCNNKIDYKLSKACGGAMAYNVFSTDTSSHLSENKGNCISLECTPDNPNFGILDCESSLNVICKGFVTNENNKPWRIQFNTCANDSMYPKGDFELSNATDSCIRIQLNDSTPRWIGIVREKFVTEEKETYVNRMERSSILMCQKCRSGFCVFTNCKELLTNDVFCKKITVPQRRKINVTDEVSLASILAPSIITLLIGVIICIALVIYKRKRRIRNKRPSDMKEDIYSERIDTEYPSVQKPTENENYVVLGNPNQNYDSSAFENSKEGNPYDFTEDGQYDHLREIKHPKEEIDDTYHHAAAVTAGDYSEYDVTGSNRNPDKEYTYDKANLNGHSENGYNEIKLREEDM